MIQGERTLSDDLFCVCGEKKSLMIKSAESDHEKLEGKIFFFSENTFTTIKSYCYLGLLLTGLLAQHT
jgi:hypothetical protein